MPADIARPLLAPAVSAAIDAAVDTYAEDAFLFLERLVAADSTVGHEQAALEVLASELHGLGFEIERLPIPEDVVDLAGAGVPRLPYAGRYDLVGRRRGRSGAAVVAAQRAHRRGARGRARSLDVAAIPA